MLKTTKEVLSIPRNQQGYSATGNQGRPEGSDTASQTGSDNPSNPAENKHPLPLKKRALQGGATSGESGTPDASASSAGPAPKDESGDISQEAFSSGSGLEVEESPGTVGGRSAIPAETAADTSLASTSSAVSSAADQADEKAEAIQEELRAAEIELKQKDTDLKTKNMRLTVEREKQEELKKKVDKIEKKLTGLEEQNSTFQTTLARASSANEEAKKTQTQAKEALRLANKTTGDAQTAYDSATTDYMNAGQQNETAQTALKKAKNAAECKDQKSRLATEEESDAQEKFNLAQKMQYQTNEKFSQLKKNIGDYEQSQKRLHEKLESAQKTATANKKLLVEKAGKAKQAKLEVEQLREKLKQAEEAAKQAEQGEVDARKKETATQNELMTILQQIETNHNKLQETQPMLIEQTATLAQQIQAKSKLKTTLETKKEEVTSAQKSADEARETHEEATKSAKLTEDAYKTAQATHKEARNTWDQKKLEEERAKTQLDAATEKAVIADNVLTKATTEVIQPSMPGVIEKKKAQLSRAKEELAAAQKETKLAEEKAEAASVSWEKINQKKVELIQQHEALIEKTSIDSEISLELKNALDKTVPAEDFVSAIIKEPNLSKLSEHRLKLLLEKLISLSYFSGFDDTHPPKIGDNTSPAIQSTVAKHFAKSKQPLSADTTRALCHKLSVTLLTPKQLSPKTYNELTKIILKLRWIVKEEIDFSPDQEKETKQTAMSLYAGDFFAMIETLKSAYRHNASLLHPIQSDPLRREEMKFTRIVMSELASAILAVYETVDTPQKITALEPLFKLRGKVFKHEKYERQNENLMYVREHCNQLPSDDQPLSAESSSRYSPRSLRTRGGFTPGTNQTLPADAHTNQPPPDTPRNIICKVLNLDDTQPMVKSVEYCLKLKQFCKNVVDRQSSPDVSKKQIHNAVRVKLRGHSAPASEISSSSASETPILPGSSADPAEALTPGKRPRFGGLCLITSQASEASSSSASETSNSGLPTAPRPISQKKRKIPADAPTPGKRQRPQEQQEALVNQIREALMALLEANTSLLQLAHQRKMTPPFECLSFMTKALLGQLQTFSLPRAESGSEAAGSSSENDNLQPIQKSLSNLVRHVNQTLKGNLPVSRPIGIISNTIDLIDKYQKQLLGLYQHDAGESSTAFFDGQQTATGVAEESSHTI